MSQFQLPPTPRPQSTGQQNCPPQRVCPLPPKCPPPRVCPLPKPCPECQPCELARLLSIDYLTSETDIKVSWMLINPPLVDTNTYRIQLSRSELFGPRDTVSYTITSNSIGDINFSNVQLGSRDQLVLGINQYRTIYARIMILVADTAMFSNMITMSRLRLNYLNYRRMNSDNMSGVISANLSMGSQLYASNVPIYIENVNARGDVISQQVATVLSVSNNVVIVNIDIASPQNVLFLSPPYKCRVYFVIGQGTPEESKFYSNYLAPQIVN